MFDKKVSELCDIYRDAQALKKDGINIVSVDEKTGIQAVDRVITAMKPNQIERHDHSYERHGTQCLMANLDIATGEIRSPTVGDRRTEEDFLAHIQRTISEAPEAEWIFIVDQLNTHKSASLVRYICEKLNIEEDLGRKGKFGILKDMESRAAFLEDKTHRIRFIYTPKHASWLNQVECWFSILVRRLLKRLVVKSTDELRDKILNFIDYYNNNLAKPFKWMFRGFQYASN